ncbi:phosphonate metabolism protein/1,5-bisphosphokinase (PRPP-forming) PhnN [Stappia sp. 28M-7]|uniref:phosphonate metabolism protein/1,5-bisphosphokinase (PRPP-forming) PhnN n=1 Tax=Stappia sp. 28M-7 TaxID=2762596 RepID=UPI00163B9C92|nr:phosphonate metabolism protein/1,5-bisphosphokinase (PRPP-forming) PhnN [Stappia sp. 28M-7]MBC2860730.1 phosphonate metabolism protein/1,5-bisphosphokinase (PRPP-forming) PhnN [Stappia sp. 28M-7]
MQGAASGGQGPLIAVVGPSGVGKDTLLSRARAALSDRPDVLFVRRSITRPASVDAEEHVPITAEAFDEAERAGTFAYCWRAHGLGYGLPASLSDHLARGHPAVINGSRKALAGMKERFPTFAVIQITAAPEVLAARLAARGRESADEIAARIARAKEQLPVAPACTIDNSGELDEAAEALVAAILELADPAPR